MPAKSIDFSLIKRPPVGSHLNHRCVGDRLGSDTGQSVNSRILDSDLGGVFRESQRDDGSNQDGRGFRPVSGGQGVPHPFGQLDHGFVSSAAQLHLPTVTTPREVVLGEV